MKSIITLTTDFGLSDAYVAEMKGVILGINPDVRLVDITHSIEPQNILQAAFVLNTAYIYFPLGSIHLVVVDPGVGTKRKAIILKTEDFYFVAPDNGVLSHIIEVKGILGKGKLPAGMEVFAISRSEYFRSPVSATFHGRDIFAPVAARLSLGEQPSDFGEKLGSIKVLPLAHARLRGQTVIGNIIHIDRFGNLITSVHESDLPKKSRLIKIEYKSNFIPMVRTYSQGEGLLALIGGGGYLEIAQKNGNASILLGAKIGDEVRLIDEGEF